MPGLFSATFYALE